MDFFDVCLSKKHCILDYKKTLIDAEFFMTLHLVHKNGLL